MRLIVFLTFIVGFALSSYTQQTNKKLTIRETRGLKDYYQDYFMMGVAVTPRSLRGEEAALITHEFNSLTAENVMKPVVIHPEENRYNWGPADEIVE